MAYSTEIRRDAIILREQFVQFMEVRGSKYIMELRQLFSNGESHLGDYVSATLDEPRRFSLGFRNLTFFETEYTVHAGNLYFLSEDAKATPGELVLSVSEQTATNQLENAVSSFAHSMGIRSRVITKSQETMEFFADLHRRRNEEREQQKKAA